MQNIFTNIKCSEIILSNANENWYIILYDLFSRLCYIATCGPFCKDATHINQVEFYATMTFYSTPSTLKSLCIFLNVDHRPYWELLLLLYAMFKSLTYLTFLKWLYLVNFLADILNS